MGIPSLSEEEKWEMIREMFVMDNLDKQEDKVYISDRAKTPVIITIEDLKKARNSKFPPFSPRNKLLRIKYP